MKRLREETGSTLVELLVASAIGLGVVLAAVQLLAMHAGLALRVQADLGATSGAAWALRAALSDVKRAGADPSRRGVVALKEGGSDRMTTQRDLDGDGTVDPRSEESVALAWADRNGGQVARRVGAQSMAIASGVPRGGLRLRYFDERGREVLAGAGLDATDRARVKRVEVEISVANQIGTVVGHASVEGAASVRVREGRP